MALDIRERRANALSVGRPWMRDKFPDASKGPEWRPSVANSYGGNRLSPVIITQSSGLVASGVQNIDRGLVALAPERGFGVVKPKRGLVVDEFE